MKNYETPVMSLFYAESKDIITVSFGEGDENDIKTVDVASALNLK